MTNEGTYKYVSINLIDKPNLSPYLDILYFKDNRIDIDRAVEVSSIILSMEEDFGTHFGSPEHISGVHNIAMHSIGMKKWVVRLLNMIHALKSSPNTRYFNSKEECVSWLENKLIKTK